MHCPLDCRMVVCAVLPLIVWVCGCVVCMYVSVWVCCVHVCCVCCMHVCCVCCMHVCCVCCMHVCWVCCVHVCCVCCMHVCCVCMYVCAHIFVGRWCVHACMLCVCMCVCAFMCGWVVYAYYVCVWERERDTVSFHTTYLYISNYVLLLKEKHNCNVCPTDTLVQVCWGTVQFCHLRCEVIPSLVFILGWKKMRILTAVLVFNKMSFDHQLFCYLWLAHVMTRWLLCIHSQHIHTLTRMHTCNTHTCLHTHTQTHTHTHTHKACTYHTHTP